MSANTENLVKKKIRKVKKKIKKEESSEEVHKPSTKNILIEFEDEEDNDDIPKEKIQETIKIEKMEETHKKSKSILKKAIKKKEIEENTPIENKTLDNSKFNSLAICFPDSIIALHQSSELRSYFISEIARMATIFCVNEIILLKDHSYKNKSPNFDSTHYLAINLQYLESPQYLRKALFPIHPDLKNAGIMNPIESKHHLKADEFHQYREGIVLNRPVKENGSGSWVDIGLPKQAKIDYKLQPLTRVTVKLNEESLEIQNKYFTGTVVSQSEPQKLDNTYWGYSVRIAMSIRDVFKKCPFDQGYDVRIFVGNEKSEKNMPPKFNFSSKKFTKDSNILIVFGGFEGLETVLEGEELSRVKKEKLFENFTHSFNFNIQNYGVKHLRLEEEIFMFLNSLTTNN